MKRVALVLFLFLLSGLSYALSLNDLVTEGLDEQIQMGLQYNRSDELPHVNVTVYLVVGSNLDYMESALASSIAANEGDMNKSFLVTFEDGKKVAVDRLYYVKASDKDFDNTAMNKPNTFVVFLGGVKGNAVVNSSVDVDGLSNYTAKDVGGYKVSTGLNADGNKITVISHEAGLVEDAVAAIHDVQSKVFTISKKIFSVMYRYSPVWTALLLSLILIVLVILYLVYRKTTAR